MIEGFANRGDHLCVSKRARSVTVAYREPPKGRITDLVIDSTGLKIFGEGEWKVRKHGTEKRRVWRKLHLAVDPVTHDIVAAEVSMENVHDAEVLPTLLTLCGASLYMFMRMKPMTVKPAKSLSCVKWRQLVSLRARMPVYGKRDIHAMKLFW